MLPQGLMAMPPLVSASALAAGFSVFLALEQLLRWHHSHRRQPRAVKPLVLLVLLGDALNNFVGGLSIASTFLINPAAGVAAWLAARWFPTVAGSGGLCCRQLSLHRCVRPGSRDQGAGDGRSISPMFRLVRDWIAVVVAPGCARILINQPLGSDWFFS